MLPTHPPASPTARAPGPPVHDVRLDLALGALRAGRLLGALTALEGLRLAPAGRPDLDSRVTAVVVGLRVARGELEAAGLLLARLPADPGVLGDPRARAAVWTARAELAAARGDDRGAAEAHARAGAAVGALPDEVGWRAGLALALVRTGEARRAVEVAEAARADALATGDQHALAVALRARASTGTCSGEDRTDLLRSARRVLDGVPAAELLARTDTDLAGLLLLGADEERRVEAVSLLRGAEAYAGRQELRPLQQRTERLLARVGETPRPVASDAVGALTATELRVAGIAARGLSNRGVAEELGVGVKAVEWHLSHVYRKLRIPSRAGLAAALGLGAV